MKTCTKNTILVIGGGPAGVCAAIAAIRVMPPCMAMGQTAGTAAALALAAGVAPRTLDTTTLVGALRSDGAFLLP